MERRTTTRIPRSDEMILVGYFLARCTGIGPTGRPCAPGVLGVTSWAGACDLFHPALGHGRTRNQFRHSLRNTRDIFDHLFDNGRSGWAEGQKRGPELSERDRRLHAEWGPRRDADLAQAVLRLIGRDPAR